jgi:hypothetical protein
MRRPSFVRWPYSLSSSVTQAVSTRGQARRRFYDVRFPARRNFSRSAPATNCNNHALSPSSRQTPPPSPDCCTREAPLGT